MSFQKSAALSEDTLWEVVTSWQDALSSRDIQLDDELLEKCAEIVYKNINLAVAHPESVVDCFEAYSEIVSKLILCSVEHYQESDEAKYNSADKIISTIFGRFNDTFEAGLLHAHQIGIFVEALNGNLILEPSSEYLKGAELGSIDAECTVSNLFKLTIFKFRAISKITCNIKENHRVIDNAAVPSLDGNDEEHTEDFCDLDESLLKKWSTLIIDEILNGIKVSSLGNSILLTLDVSHFLHIYIYFTLLF